MPVGVLGFEKAEVKRRASSEIEVSSVDVVMVVDEPSIVDVDVA